MLNGDFPIAKLMGISSPPSHLPLPSECFAVGILTKGMASTCTAAFAEVSRQLPGFHQHYIRGQIDSHAPHEVEHGAYFGDDHPEGGLTSFTYFLDKNGEKQTVGGWLPNADELGDDWAEKYHVFSVEWTPKEYVFRIDGEVTQRLKGVSSGKPEFLILSLLSSDFELPRFNGELPETMEVDWARVWETGPE